MEAHLKSLGACVRRGGAFDRWDLEVQGGIFGGARMIIAVEDHDGGKQLIRMRSWPVLSNKALLAAFLFGCFSTLAALEHAWTPPQFLAASACGFFSTPSADPRRLRRCFAGPWMLHKPLGAV
jgi:hypothetical protein